MLPFLFGVGVGCVATYCVMIANEIMEAIESLDNDGGYDQDDTAEYPLYNDHII